MALVRSLKLCSRDKILHIRKAPALMGIVNVTPDSFSDGGLYLDPGKACDRALQLFAHGADIVDIGGQSTRPGASSITAQEELSRVLPVIKRLRKQTKKWISIDSFHEEVVLTCLREGVDMINDVTALKRSSHSMPEIVRAKVAVVLMHMKGTPSTMQKKPRYRSVIGEVGDYLKARAQHCLDQGMATHRIILDPGFGFGKTYEHNIKLVDGFSSFLKIGLPLLAGVSRKSFVGKLSGADVAMDRLAGSLAVGWMCVHRGAAILRVHDVKEHKQFFKTMETLDKN